MRWNLEQTVPARAGDPKADKTFREELMCFQFRGKERNAALCTCTIHFSTHASQHHQVIGSRFLSMTDKHIRRSLRDFREEGQNKTTSHLRTLLFVSRIVKFDVDE